MNTNSVKIRRKFDETSLGFTGTGVVIGGYGC
jgi:hypothetical protein